MEEIWQHIQNDPALSQEVKTEAMQLKSSSQCYVATLDAMIFSVAYSSWPRAQQVAA